GLGFRPEQLPHPPTQPDNDVNQQTDERQPDLPEPPVRGKDIGRQIEPVIDEPESEQDAGEQQNPEYAQHPWCDAPEVARFREEWDDEPAQPAENVVKAVNDPFQDSQQLHTNPVQTRSQTPV